MFTFISIRRGRSLDRSYLLSFCFLHWYLSYLEKFNHASLRKLFTEYGVMGFCLYLSHLWVTYVFLYLGLSSIGVRENLGDYGRHLATGVVLFEPWFRLLMVELLDSGLDTAVSEEHFSSFITMPSLLRIEQINSFNYDSL